MSGGIGTSYFEVDLETQGGVGQSWFRVILETDGTVPPDPEPEKIVSGGADEGFTSGGGAPIADGQRFKLKGALTWEVPTERRTVQFSASHSLLRQYTILATATSRIHRTYTFTEKVSIKPADRWNFVLRDDDELINII